MVRFAVLADIHGNLPALEAVMADLQAVAPDRVIVAGDVVNRGPQSKECVQAIRAAGWPALFGNHEEYVLKYVDHVVPHDWYGEAWLPFLQVVRELDGDEIAYLRALPWFLVVDAPGLPPIRVVHGSPRALNDGFGPWHTDAQLMDAVGLAPETILIGAHTHRAMDRRVGDRWLLNTGSVGAPFNGNPGAQYLVMTGSNGAWHTDFRCVPYDRARTYEAWERTGYIQHNTTGRIFKYEVETATYHYFLYLDFCKANHLDDLLIPSFEAYRAATRFVTPGRTQPGWLRYDPNRPVIDR